MGDIISNPKLSFNQKLTISIATTFIVFVAFIMIFQYNREKSYKVSLMTEQIDSYNNLIYEVVQEDGVNDSSIFKVISFLKIEDLRVTIIDLKGNVLFDSEADSLKNHLDRPEIQNAIAIGKGVSVRRKSETTGKTFFYAATKYDDIIVRCSRPYGVTLNKLLRVDYNFMIFSAILLIIMLYFIFRTTRRMGLTIKQLRDFAQSADDNKYLDTEQEFPKNELGEISQHIVSLFKSISTTRDDLIVEREKLITHLQTSREGLAVFSSDKKEILANNIFIQYSNLISNSTIEKASSIFDIPEFAGINSYVQQNIKVGNLLSHLQKHSIQIEKNGKIFHVQCIIFQDRSFEVSINDITQSEEESRIKRQLTQNIAHELKTPVSSIQGYMETIITNPDLPSDKMQKFIERSYVQSRRLSELLSDISTLNRMDDAPKLLEKEDVIVSKLLEQISGEVEAEMENKGMRLIINIDDDIIVNGNRSLLYSVFRNLIDNSLAYAGENIEMGVSCYRKDTDRYYFNYYDTGVGVSEEHLNRIFERFYRVDKGRTRKSGGTGLGLAIVKNAVQLHGGTISAKNRSEGGLEFIFSLLKS